MPATIHIAYSVSRTHGHTSYWAKAAVTDEGFKGYNTVRTGVGDSALEAIDEALGYVIVQISAPPASADTGARRRTAATGMRLAQ